MKDNDVTATTHNAPTGTSWWNRSLTRRDAQKAGATAVSLAALLKATGCDDDETMQEMDALEAQRSSTWDIGDEGVPLLFADVSPIDSTGDANWREWTDPARLLDVTRPTRDALNVYFGPTLVQSLEQVSLAAQMKPVLSDALRASYGRGRSLASLLSSTEKPEETLLILDLPGPHAVAAAAGMAADVEPVFFFDNWPHPKGVVPAHQTLGALVAFARELDALKTKRTEDPSRALPTAIVLDANRLTSFSAGMGLFDNRYTALIPSADDAKKLGFTRVLYATLNEAPEEQDDLNEALVAYDAAGVSVTMIAFSAFEIDPSVPVENSETGGYYYGGGRESHTHFYTHYPLFLWLPLPGYSRWTPPAKSKAPPKVRPPAYKPASRPTRFASRAAGGAAGVGRAKPTGFGRVSTRVDGNGRIISGRGGSAGRSRTGFFGG